MSQRTIQSVWGKILQVMRVLFSSILILSAVAVSATAIYLCVVYSNTDPILLSTPASVRNDIVEMMDAVCMGDYDKASTFIQGEPDFGVDRDASNEAGTLIWNAFLDSTEYELVGECYTTKLGLAQDIEFTYLDMSSVTKNLNARSQALLEERVANAVEISEVYDENNEYRTDVVNEVVITAVKDAIIEDGTYVTAEITINLQYQDGKWMIVGDKELYDTIFGKVLF